MREQGIASLPRNYELVYRFLNSSNPAFVREFAALGRRPTQLQLDAIGMKFLPHQHPVQAVEHSLECIFEEMRKIIRMFKQDRSRLEKYSNLLGESSARISTKGTLSLDVLDDLNRVLSSATADTMEKSKAIIQQIVERAKELARLKAELEEYKRLSGIDPVTRLSNRRAFDKRLAAIYEDLQAAVSQALLIADIDHFKKFNDTYGHQVGDRVLSATAAVMTKALGSETFLARTGGEEFAVILDNTSVEEARDTAERLRVAIESTPLKDQNDGLDRGRITVSLGVCMAADASGPENLYKRADAMLYEAKKSGRNQVKTYTPKMKRIMGLLKR
ncbi:MAG: GGDEF domain-containing protein [Hoeflea sp.]|uniref:GGDEF domain-containing protein n=1 Tax=Hoeflea sp. TaxID=1940281 RepID=UPI00273043F9|nr:GGDEF domain-containing protein [Hoeflea sp.]MDP2122647.1 GGDEF domain-containing protein [Hoeflea sp.]